MDSSTQEWIIGGAAIGAMAMLWGHVKSAWDMAKSLVITTVVVDQRLQDFVMWRLWREARRFPLGQPQYTVSDIYSRKSEKYETVILETASKSTMVFWMGWRPVLVNKSSDTNNKNAPEPAGSTSWHPSLSLSFLRGTFNADDFLFDTIQKYMASQEIKRFCIHHWHGSKSWIVTSPYFFLSEQSLRPIRHSCDDIMRRPATSPSDKLVMTQDMKNTMDEAIRWKSLKTWYREHKISWRRGLLFEGPPGSGKSSMAVAIGETLDVPVNVIDVAGMNNESFRSVWNAIMSNAPAIVLIEDIDVVFDGRKNITTSQAMRSDRFNNDGPNLSFDCFLNTIDGAMDADGVLLIMTTNDSSKVDPALRDRPGRVDRVVKFGPIPLETRLKIARRILKDNNDVLIDQVVSDGDGEVGATFTERCVRMAMHELWGQKTRMDEIVPVPRGSVRSVPPLEIPLPEWSEQDYQVEKAVREFFDDTREETKPD